MSTSTYLISCRELAQRPDASDKHGAKVGAQDREDVAIAGSRRTFTACSRGSRATRKRSGNATPPRALRRRAPQGRQTGKGRWRRAPLPAAQPPFAVLASPSCLLGCLFGRQNVGPV